MVKFFLNRGLASLAFVVAIVLLYLSIAPIPGHARGSRNNNARKQRKERFDKWKKIRRSDSFMGLDEDGIDTSAMKQALSDLEAAMDQLDDDELGEFLFEEAQERRRERKRKGNKKPGRKRSWLDDDADADAGGDDEDEESIEPTDLLTVWFIILVATHAVLGGAIVLPLGILSLVTAIFVYALEALWFVASLLSRLVGLAGKQQNPTAAATKSETETTETKKTQ